MSPHALLPALLPGAALLAVVSPVRAGEGQDEGTGEDDPDSGSGSEEGDADPSSPEDEWDMVFESPDPEEASSTDSGSASPSGGDFSLSQVQDRNLRWRGYYENQFAVMAWPAATEGGGVTPEDLDLLDYNKVRLQATAIPGGGVSARVVAIARTWHGSTQWDLREILPETFESDLDLLASWDESLATWSLEDDFYLNDAWLRARAGAFDLRVGRQQMRFGSGYLWNPSDPFTVKDLLDPAYEKVGVTAARMQLHLPWQGLLEGYLLPRPSPSPMLEVPDAGLDDLAWALRGRVGPGRWVFAASWSSFQDIAALDTAAFSMEEALLLERRHLLGAEITGEIAGIGLWAEGAYNRVDPDLLQEHEAVAEEAWFEAVAGAQYTFRGGVQVMAEGLYNERGDATSEDYTLWDWFLYLDQTLRYLGRWYGSGTLLVPVNRWYMRLYATGMLNVSDGSWLFNPRVEYDWNQYLALSAYGAISGGPTDTAEMSSFGTAGYLRARLSF